MSTHVATDAYPLKPCPSVAMAAVAVEALAERSCM